MTAKPLTSVSDIFTVHIVNGSVLIFLRDYTLEQIQMVILNLQITKTEEWLLWATLIFTVVQTVHLLIQIIRLFIRYLNKLIPKLKSIYAKLVKKNIRRQRRQSEQ